MDCSIDFQPYLSSICHDYAEWQKFYTLTDIEGKSKASSDQNKRVVPFDFGLMMRSVNNREPEASRQEKAQKPERRPVLDGLRNSLAEATHILLVGRPGSGKSTALARLLLEEAQQNQGDAGEKRIPVLVELRYYQTSVLDLIQDFFRRHNLVLEIHQVETLLSQNHLLLLVDGLNELPSEAARQDIVKLRNHRRVPMIFTTRDLSLGGDFGIEKQWEMLPLTELQMQEFIKSHLSSEQADAMWRQLKDRTRKFAETPLLLWMLCELFGQVEEIPHNLGEVFRVFTRAYENNSIRKHGVAALKGDVQPLSDRRLWFPALHHLAYLMMQGETPVDSRTVISREEAEEELQALFSQEPYPDKTARDCLDDLMKYHLLQIKSGNEIEFRHQLFQEYYAAEWLVQQLPNLSDEQLKYYFLNYLKWTEAIAIALGFLDNETQLLYTVKLALETDLMLGARLAGSTKFELQERTVGLVIGLEVPQPLRTELLGNTKSKYITATLSQILLDKTSGACRVAAEVLSEIGNDSAIIALTQSLNNDDFFSDSSAHALAAIGSRKSKAALVKALNSNISNTRRNTAYALAEIGEEAALTILMQDLDDDNDMVRRNAAEALAGIHTYSAVYALSQSLNDKDYFVQESAVYALAKIGTDSAKAALTEALNHKDSFVRGRAADALEAFGNESAINSLISAFSDDLYFNRNKGGYKYATALAKDNNKSALVKIVEALRDTDFFGWEGIVDGIGDLGQPDLIHILWKLMLNGELSYLYRAISAIQSRCKFYNYDIAQSIPPPPINSEKLSANGSPTYNFYGSVGNVANTVHRNQITNQQKDLKEEG